IPCGAWRGPPANTTGFANQSFIHEIAVATGRDHLALLLELFGEPRNLDPKNVVALHTGRAAAVTKLAAEKIGWGQPQPKGRALGLAFSIRHPGTFACAADVSVDANKRITVHRLVLAGDIGPVVNLASAEHQVTGSALDAISTMMDLQISFENGRITQTN